MINSRSHNTMPDPCRDKPTFSASRFFLFLPFFLMMIPGGAVLFIVLADHSLGIQFASMIVYTAAAFLYTFSSNRGLPRYLFSCPVVRRQLYRLAVRHLGFLTALFIIETTAFQLRPRMPASWFVSQGKNVPPFTITLFILCGGLLLVQVLTNRSALRRAHFEHSRD